MKEKFKVFISGQKYFAGEVFRLCQKMEMEIVGVCCPLDDKYIGDLARLWNVPIIPAGMLNGDTMPKCDLGITARLTTLVSEHVIFRVWVGSVIIRVCCLVIVGVRQLSGQSVCTTPLRVVPYFGSTRGLIGAILLIKIGVLFRLNIISTQRKKQQIYGEMNYYLWV